MLTGVARATADKNGTISRITVEAYTGFYKSTGKGVLVLNGIASKAG